MPEQSLVVVLMRRAADLLAGRVWHVAVGSLAAGLALSSASADVGLAAAALVLPTLAAARAPALGVLAAGLVLAGAAIGEARLATIDAPAAKVKDGDQASFRAHLLTRPRPSAFGASAEIRVTTGKLSGARLLLRIARWTRLPPHASIGAELALSGQLRAPRARRSRTGPAPSSNSFDFAAYLRGRGIAGELLADRARATGLRRDGVAGLLDRMRERAERAVAEGMPRDAAALLRGMVLGQDEAIDEPTREDWRRAGLAHLLSVT